MQDNKPAVKLFCGVKVVTKRQTLHVGKVLMITCSNHPPSPTRTSNPWSVFSNVHQTTRWGYSLHYLICAYLITAQQALTLAYENSQASLTILSSRDSNSSVDSPSDLHIILTDFISLLSLLHGATTKIALSLNPSSPTYQAALTPLKEVAERVPALSHSVSLIDRSHGAILLKEVEFVAIDVIQSIKSLMQTLLEETKPNTGSVGRTTEMYLVRTGAVHDTIERARTQNSISRDNLAAVRKLWIRDHDSLVDALEEAREVCEGADSMNDEFNDGWDELGISTENLKPVELERATKVILAILPFLYLNTLLCRR